MKKFLLSLYIKLRLKILSGKNEPYDFSHELSKTRKILVIISSGHEYSESFQLFISRLSELFSKSRVSTFVKSSLRKSDLNWFGLPNEKYLKIIREENFDLILDLNIQQDDLSAFLCAFSGAPLRLNLSSGIYDDIYNLHFRPSDENSIEKKLENVLSYLKYFTKQKEFK